MLMELKMLSPNVLVFHIHTGLLAVRFHLLVAEIWRINQLVLKCSGDKMDVRKQKFKVRYVLGYD